MKVGEGTRKSEFLAEQNPMSNVKKVVGVISGKRRGRKIFGNFHAGNIDESQGLSYRHIGCGHYRSVYTEALWY